MGAMFDVPHNLERWPNRKAPFHTRKLGKNVLLSSECSIAERETPLSSRDDGVVYTAEPVAVGDVWRITVLSRASKWMNGLVSAVDGRPWVLCAYAYTIIVMMKKLIVMV